MLGRLYVSRCLEIDNSNCGEKFEKALYVEFIMSHQDTRWNEMKILYIEKPIILMILAEQ
jgi:hypothetical protein